MNVLSLDYGLAHTGIAFADGPLAQPLFTVPTKNLFVRLPQILDQFKPEKIIISRLNQELMAHVEELSRFISRLSSAQICLFDETLTTYDAKQALLHRTKSARKSLEHQAAAAILLQSWLDAQGVA
jgi:RNase H-fold protein (predicted Holliday junction resolvase)